MIEAVTNDLVFALRLADLADEITNIGFHARDYAVRTKDDGSPVTDVDVRVEEALAGQIEPEHPRDGFLSEELGQVRTQGGTQRTWVVDGIDGTSAFIAGGPTWGTLIALVQDDEVKLGIASSPGLQRRWWASRGGGAWTGELTPSGFASESVRLAVSARRMKPRGSVLPPEGLLSGWRDQAVRRAASFLSPPGAPGHGPLLVAAGEIEVSVYLAGGPWDHAPFVVLVEEAGGEFSDLWGGRRIDTATAIFSNGLAHRDVRAEVMVAAPDRPQPDDAP
jgi:histidinol-phosphatase